MHIIANTPRFVIRNFKAEEEEQFMSLFNDEQVTLHLPKRSRKENLEIFKKTLDGYSESPSLGRWGIFNNANGELIGMCLLRNYENGDEKVELGYVLARKFWGKGIASEMALIMVAYGFTHIKTKEIVAVTTLGNAGSQKVLEKAGLIRMDDIKRDGEELAYFSLVRQA